MNSDLLNPAGWSHFLSRAEDTAKVSGSDIPLSAWQDELGRLRVWASDAGVHDESRRTLLEEQINRHPFIKKQVLRQLARVEQLMQDLEDIVNPQGRDEQDSDLDVGNESDDEADRDNQPKTAIREIFMNFEDSISGLNQMSAMLAQRLDGNAETTVRVEQDLPQLAPSSSGT